MESQAKNLPTTVSQPVENSQETIVYALPTTSLLPSMLTSGLKTESHSVTSNNKEEIKEARSSSSNENHRMSAANHKITNSVFTVSGLTFGNPSWTTCNVPTSHQGEPEGGGSNGGSTTGNHEPPFLSASRPQSSNSSLSAHESSGSTSGATSINVHSARFQHVPTRDLSDYLTRLETFRSWPYENVQSSVVLAQAGFWYTSILDKVSCFSCGKSFFNWERNDNPWKQHALWIPKCDHIIESKGRDFIDRVVQESAQRQPEIKPSDTKTPGQAEELNSLMEEMSIQPRGRDQQPRHEDYKDENIRRSTFRNWPIPQIQSPNRLSEAGFFYKGTGDQVTCYQCGYTLHNWEITDVPQEEHKKWNPQCPLVLVGEQPIGASVRRRDREKHGSEEVAAGEERTHEVHKQQLSMGASTLTSAQGCVEGHASDDSKLCKICLSEEIKVVFLPCGHLVCCEQCANRVSHCPICRKYINGTVKAYWG